MDGIFELCEEDVIIYNKVKKMTENGKDNYVKICKDNDQGNESCDDSTFQSYGWGLCPAHKERDLHATERQA